MLDIQIICKVLRVLPDILHDTLARHSMAGPEEGEDQCQGSCLGRHRYCRYVDIYLDNVDIVDKYVDGRCVRSRFLGGTEQKWSEQSIG